MDTGRRVFRGHPIAAMIGLVFFAAGLGFAIGIATTAPSEGILVNEVRRYDFGPIAGAVAFSSVFALIGAAIAAGTIVARIEADEEGLRIYNLVNRRVFDAGWIDIQSYERRGKKQGKDRHWHVVAGGQSADVPIPGKLAELHRLVLRRLPRGVLVGDTRPEPPREVPAETVVKPLRTARDFSTMAFSIVWYAFLAFFAFGVVSQPVDSPSSAFFKFALAPTMLLGFAGVMAPIAFPAWSRFLFGHLEIGPSGVMVRERGKETAVFWSSLRLVEEVVTRDDDSSTRELLLITDDASVAYPDYWPEYALVRRYAVALAPKDAIFAGL